MADQGFVKIFRKFKKWGWYQKSEMVHLFLHFLLSANHEDGVWQGNLIKRGQFITGRNSLHKDTGISPQSIRTSIMRLKSTNEITTKSTNKFTLITIVNWEDYQLKSTNKLTSKSTNNQPTTNQQLTTNKNDKNDKNEKKELATLPLRKDQEVFNALEAFKPINPAYTRFFSNKTQRSAMERLIKKWGSEKIISIIGFLQKSNKIPFAPGIHSPYDLEQKMAALIDFTEKKKIEIENKKPFVGKIR